MIRFRSILVPVDGSLPAQAALEAACELARANGGRVTALHVREAHLQLAGRHVHTMPPDADIARRAVTILRAATERAREGYGIEIDTEVADGDPVEAILSAVKRRASDSVVMGNRGHGGLTRLLLGSVAEGVVRASPVPVVVLHAPPSEPADATVEERVNASSTSVESASPDVPTGPVR